MEIVEADEPSTVTIALECLRPFTSLSTATFRLSPEGDGTRVTWTMTGSKSS